MKAIKQALGAVDTFQQRHRAAGFVYAVQKKYGDDNAGALVAQLTYTMFVTIFPLLLLLITILGLVLAGDPSARARITASAFGEFPIVGHQLAGNIHALKRGSLIGLIIGIVGLIYGSTSLAQTGLSAMSQVWNVPFVKQPNFLAGLARSLLFLVVLALELVVTTVLSGFGTFGRHNIALGVLAELFAGLANVAFYIGTFRVLTPKQVAIRTLLPGAIVGGVFFTILQAVGGYVVGHDLKGASATYGLFGVVLGLIAWLYLGARATLYAAEVSTVLHHHLWPRALVQPPLTDADERAMRLQVLALQRRPEQQIVLGFTAAGEPTKMADAEVPDPGPPAAEGAKVGHQ
ncbi:MAG TPA: YihY/virulence factor BrkB family protein [Acidimicrobiales bacterium]|nr:YihY/virulence factor BrkB family protein [Acidimicrobiales bacterium]